MAVLQLLESLAEVRADSAGVLTKVVGFNHVNDSSRSRAGNRIAAEGGYLQALEAGGNLRRRDGGADGNAVPEAFRRRNHVRHNFPLLDSKPLLACTAPPGLYFVADEQPAVILDDLEHDFEVLRRGRDEPAQALDGLRHERGDLARGGGLNDSFDVLCAFNAALGRLLTERTAIAIRIQRVDDTHTARQ